MNRKKEVILGIVVLSICWLATIGQFEPGQAITISGIILGVLMIMPSEQTAW